MVCHGWNSLWLCAHFLWLRAHSHDCVHILPRGPSSPSLSSSSSSLSSPLPACNNRGWFKFKSQPVTIYVRIRTQSEYSQQQSNIKCHNQTQKQEYIQYLQYSTVQYSTVATVLYSTVQYTTTQTTSSVVLAWVVARDSKGISRQNCYSEFSSTILSHPELANTAFEPPPTY